MIDDLLDRYFNASVFYITVETVGRESIIIGSVINRLLRTVLTEVKQAHKFQTLGFVLLPDHIHLLIKPDGRVALDAIMQALARQFESEYATLMGQPQPTPVWQRSFLARRPIDQADFGRHLDWIHYNPVYHQQVEKPEAWPYSSYQAWIERGLYGAEWGTSLPESIKGKRWG
jgi:putative transposase